MPSPDSLVTTAITINFIVTIGPTIITTVKITAYVRSVSCLSAGS